MKIMKTLFTLVIALAFIMPAMADEAEGIKLSIEAHKETLVINKDGEKEIKLVRPESVLPGDVVVYTIHYHNRGKDNADDVTITNAIPEHMLYLDDSAAGDETLITYSVDGGNHYDLPENLTVENADGTSRPATAQDYTHIRWLITRSLQADAKGVVSYRARLK